MGHEFLEKRLQTVGAESLCYVCSSVPLVVQSFRRASLPSSMVLCLPLWVHRPRQSAQDRPGEAGCKGSIGGKLHSCNLLASLRPPLLLLWFQLFPSDTVQLFFLLDISIWCTPYRQLILMGVVQPSFYSSEGLSVNPV